jgi:hypothetical protein
MNCWHCDRPAHGICRFCGRAVCKDHAQTMPFISEVYHTRTGEQRALVIGNVIFCGECEPKEDPIKMQGLDG